jgi:hypothetical protein
LEAIAKYERTYRIQQNNLFDDKPDNIWAKIGNGTAFCELARGFLLHLQIDIYDTLLKGTLRIISIVLKNKLSSTKN